MDIERAIRDFRAAQDQAKWDLYGEISEEIRRRFQNLRALASAGLSPPALRLLRRLTDDELLSRLLERVVEAPEPNEMNAGGRRRKGYQPIDGKFDTYASHHIRLFVRDKMSEEQRFVPLDNAPVAQAREDEVPTNSLTMEEIHDVLEAEVTPAMDSATEVEAKTKILYAMDHMPNDSVPPGNLARLCREAGLSRHRRERIIRLMSERPPNYEEQVRKTLGISQSAARKRVDRAEPHLSGPLREAMVAVREELERLGKPPSDGERDAFFNDR